MTVYEFFYIVTSPIYIFAVYKLLNLFFDDKQCNIKRRNILFLIYFIAMSVIVFITRLPLVNFAVSFTFHFLCANCYKASLKKKVFAASTVYAFGAALEFISSAIFGYVDFFVIIDNDFNSPPILVFVRVTMLVSSYILNRYVKSFKGDNDLPKIYYFAFFSILFGTLYLFLSQLTNEFITVNMIIINSIILIIVNVMVIAMDEKIYKAIVYKNERNLFKQQNEALSNQMEIISQSNEAIRLLKHDYKDHLLMLAKLFENGNSNEALEYIETILGNIDNEAFANSNNYVIDSVLNFKLRNIKRSDIALDLSINVPLSINIIPHDLTVIIGNLVDNAISACLKSKEKILSIKIDCKMNNLIILIDNSYDGKILSENGILKTTKLYKENHGLGITSVKKIIEKYDGDINFDYTSDVFSASAIIPY